MNGTVLFLGVVLICAGILSSYYYVNTYNRITSEYFDKGFEMGLSGDLRDLPELVDEEIQEKQGILPFLYIGIAGIVIGIILSIAGIAMDNNNRK